MSEAPPLRIGTRGSALARWQADWIATQLTERGASVEQITIETEGDVTTGPLSESGGIGLFTKAIQRALLEKRIDLAVHSLKDLPTEPTEGLCLAAVPEREACGDVLVTPAKTSLGSLPQGARVGTGSPRRRAQLLRSRDDLVMLDIRGNVGTRLSKLDRGEYDAIILAEAGLRRLGLIERITHILPLEIMLPAVGQGALGIECRTDDAATRKAVQPLDDPTTHACVLAERTLLHHLQAGCLAPVGVLGKAGVTTPIRLRAIVLSEDGSCALTAEAAAPQVEAEALGHAVADELLSQGAAELIESSRHER